MTLHELLDYGYGQDGDEVLRRMLEEGADANESGGPRAETALHVATRRRRKSAVEILLDHGVDVDARTTGGKSAWVHAVRRSFDEVADVLARGGADTTLADADRFAVAVVNGRLDEARSILAVNPAVARTGNSEEDRLLADVAGRGDTAPVRFLIESGADLGAPGLDSGTPLHQAAWFGQPDNARLLIDAGAPLDVFDTVHESSPIGWAAHGSRHSGGAAQRQDVYVEVVKMLLAAGAGLSYPGEPESDAYLRRLVDDASPRVREVLQAHNG